MDFVSGSYLFFLAIGLIVFYSTPKKWQQYVLLLFSVLFYCLFSVKLFIVMLCSVVISYFGAILLQNKKGAKSKYIFVFSISSLLLLLFVLKLSQSTSILNQKLGLSRLSILVPIGISFYTLQMVAYLIDVKRGTCDCIRNPFTYLLYITYFPQILQGPIPRVNQLTPQLKEGHTFQYEQFVGGFELLLWGYFQKMVIADRANIIVNRLFGEYENYTGMYMILAAFLYSIQLYTDFNGCVCIAKGSSEMFGIKLAENFQHPYFATSIQDFWRRWHISLSSFLKDYVYIPLGGNRKGIRKKYRNILLTFALSGIWHGMGVHYMIWGLLHGLYQVVGALCMPIRDYLVKVFHVNRNTFSHALYQRVVTFILVALAWVFFRASSVYQAISMIKSMVTTFNPWILWDGSLHLLGLTPKNVTLLFVSILVLWIVSFMQERMNIREEFQKQGIVFRYFVLLLTTIVILVFGLYGPGYDATAFIYGGF